VLDETWSFLFRKVRILLDFNRQHILNDISLRLPLQDDDGTIISFEKERKLRSKRLILSHEGSLGVGRNLFVFDQKSAHIIRY